MNIFNTLEKVRETYRQYVFTFQKFKNPVIQGWVNSKLSEGGLLWKDPYIELNQRFESGASLEQLVKEGLLHSKVLEIFTYRKGEELTKEPVKLYKHQEQAIRSIVGQKQNTIITTGTGSGKSFCFGIPIINDCLRMKEEGHKGIKAILIYPMNALANSQYLDFSQRLHKSGLTIALYTGDTETNPKEALDNYKGRTNRDKTFDCELLSRTEIQDDPPDILMTNYVMLEYLLTRFEDKKLFPVENQGILQYLVLDEVHTYSGQRGADVACLVRRLKERTGTLDTLRCIGTSATVQSGEGEKAEKLISTFAQDIFGEQFSPEAVVGESLLHLPFPKADVLSTKVGVTPELIESFQGTMETARPLVEALSGTKMEGEFDDIKLGELLSRNQAIQFLYGQLTSSSESLSNLARHYQREIRTNVTLEEALLELQAALLVGSLAQITVEGKPDHLFVPKVHEFFSQGRTITSCVTKDGPHLNDKGENICNQCQTLQKPQTFPLTFCRACGQEYYGIYYNDENTVFPRSIDDSIVEDGTNAYLAMGNYSVDKTLPDEWTTAKTNKIKKGREESVPSATKYCPIHNKIHADCECQGIVEVTLVPHPFLLCVECGVHYDRRPREFSKLFIFGSIGRSTGTDVLISEIVSHLDSDERKLIAFSDSRQDTALQAAHLNNLHKRFQFRRNLYHTLRENGFVEDATIGLGIDDVGNKIYETMDKRDIIPELTEDSSSYFGNPHIERIYCEYLTFCTLLDLAEQKQRNQQNLEQVGLLRVRYKGITKLANDHPRWSEIPILRRKTPQERIDFLSGIFDIFRRQLAIKHKHLDYRIVQNEVLTKLSPDIMIHSEGPAYSRTGYSDTIDTKRAFGWKILRLTHSRSRQVVWTKRVFGIDDNEQAVEIIENLFKMLQETKFVVKTIVRKGKYKIGEALQLNSLILELVTSYNDVHKVCKKCGTITSQFSYDQCIGYNCGGLKEQNYSKNYFRRIYTLDYNQVVAIKAHEHSGQLDGDTRQTIEKDFRDDDDPLNVLVCTPTLELGIDIGTLSSIYLRNVPPNPSNYSQRAGRAGRRGQPSLITTFCGVGSARGPHDQYFYRFPDKIIAGKISPPHFLLDNENLIRRHLRSTILGVVRDTFNLKSGIGDMLNLKLEGLPMMADYKADIDTALIKYENTYLETAESIFAPELAAYGWFDSKLIKTELDRFPTEFEKVIKIWRMDYIRFKKEHEALSMRQTQEKATKADAMRMLAIGRRLEDMRDGNGDYYTYRYLQSNGFLPNYGFPSKNIVLNFIDRDDRIERDAIIALSEFAPGSSIYYSGQTYQTKYARPKTEQHKPVTEALQVCENCETVLRGKVAKSANACPRCEAEFESPHLDNAITIPDAVAQKISTITSDDEERRRLGYDIKSFYAANEITSMYEVQSSSGKSILQMEYDHNGTIITLNRGTRKQEQDQQDKGFVLCTACDRWLFGTERIAVHTEPDHAGRCPKNATPEDILHQVILFTEGRHDVMAFHIECPEGIEDVGAFYSTLMTALLQGIRLRFSLDESELDGFIRPTTDGIGFEIIIFESADGGIGALEALKENTRFEETIAKALELIHYNDDSGCNKACYECLLSYYNQPDHALIDRTLIVPILEMLQDVIISPFVVKPESSIQKLLASCDSNLEKDVLNQIYNSGIPIPDKGQHIIFDGKVPVAKLDFYYEKQTIAVFVDGPPHDKDYVMKDDEKKRARLKELGYRVHGIRYDSIKEDITKLSKLVHSNI